MSVNSAQERRAKKVAAGYCQICTARLATDGKKSCTQCREKSKKRSQAYRQANPGKVKAVIANWVSRNKTKVQDRHRRWRAANGDASKASCRRVREKLRKRVFEHYGLKCRCCGERYEFLTLDHKDGSGAEHRKRLGTAGGTEFYRWVIKNGFPDYLQSMCMNCNWAKHVYGVCPHTQTKSG